MYSYLIILRNQIFRIASTRTETLYTRGQDIKTQAQQNLHGFALRSEISHETRHSTLYCVKHEALCDAGILSCMFTGISGMLL